MTNPKPVYLPPGVDPTQIERPLTPGGCMRYIAIAALFLGLCGGVGLGATLFGSKPAAPTVSPKPTITLMPSRTPTGTLQPTATPTLIDIMHDITVTPGPTATNTPQVCWYYHRITRGETLIGLANHFGVSVATIQSWNGIKNPNIILWGFSLKIQTTCKAATMPPTPSSTPNEQPVSVIEVF